MDTEEGTSINQSICDVTTDTQPLIGDDERTESDVTTNLRSEVNDGQIQRSDESDKEYVSPGKQKARSRCLTVEIPVALTCLIVQMLITLETEYIHDRVSADYNSSQALNQCNMSENSTAGSIEADVQSETSRWLFYLGLAYSVPSKNSIVVR